MRNWSIVVAIVFAGALANAAPSAGAVNPVQAYLFPDDDNYTGSGREVKAATLKLPARRTLWLRLRFDADNAALLGIVGRIPQLIAEEFPELVCDRTACDLLYLLIRQTFEHVPSSLEILARQTQIPVEIAAEKIDVFERAGLVQRAGNGAAEPHLQGLLPMPKLRERGRRFVERLYDALAEIDV